MPACHSYPGAGEFVPAHDASLPDVAKAALTVGLVYLPRTTRLATGTLATLASADMLHFAHAWLGEVRLLISRAARRSRRSRRRACAR